MEKSSSNKSSISTIGSSLKQSLSNLTSIKNNNNESTQENNESSINNEENNKSSITSIIKSPSLKTITQVSEKISENKPSFFSMLNIAFFLLILFILGVFGFIIYKYLLDDMKNIKTLFAPLINFITQFTGNINNNVTDGSTKILETTTETGKNIIKNTKDGTNVTLNTLESSVKSNPKSKHKQKSQPKSKSSIVESQNSQDLIDDEDLSNEPEPVRTQSLNSGYCYIGKVNDTRHCTKVDARSKCMSGDIYPTMDICVNPNLRA
tara:strand:- start:2086 stop:2880 length:795 start_codon:yes stop_codon:yes gene_type:complete